MQRYFPLSLPSFVDERRAKFRKSSGEVTGKSNHF